VRGEAGGEAVLFQTCFVQHNAPDLGRDVVEVLRASGVDVRAVKGLACCGMPAWETGDLERLRAQARVDLDLLLPFVERGAKVLVVNPTCSMMMRREWPHLLAEDRARAIRLAAAVMDRPSTCGGPQRPRFNAAPSGRPAAGSPSRTVSSGTQGIGFATRPPRKIRGHPGRHGDGCGTTGRSPWGRFEASRRIGRRRSRAEEAEAVWATDCPLAALQFAQHGGKRPLHPLSILARAYRENGFADLEGTR
jgi:Fe-S oxidoreductase